MNPNQEKKEYEIENTFGYLSVRDLTNLYKDPNYTRQPRFDECKSRKGQSNQLFFRNSGHSDHFWRSTKRQVAPLAGTGTASGPLAGRPAKQAATAAAPRSRSRQPEAQGPRAGLCTVTFDPTSTIGPTLAATTGRTTDGSRLGIRLLSGIPGGRWPAAQRPAVEVSPPAPTWGFLVRVTARLCIWRERTPDAQL